MPGLRFGERLVVFVGIGLCVVFDWLKCRVTREKPDVCPECVEWLRWAKEDLQPILDKMGAAVASPERLHRATHEIHRLKWPDDVYTPEGRRARNIQGGGF